MSNEPGSPNTSDEAVADGTQPYTGWPADVLAASHEAPKKKSKRGKRKPMTTPPISITSLTDCVTLLLVYLLKSFTTSPIEVKEPSLQIPMSSSIEKIEESTIVMLTGPVVKRQIGTETKLIPVVPHIIVDGKPVLDMDEKTYRVPDKDKDPRSGNYVIVSLREALKKAKEAKEITKAISGKDFSGKVIILADKATPYRVLTDVLVTCGDAGFGDFRFAVIRRDN